jgi:PhzF family phenazine biosynthesis protein
MITSWSTNTMPTDYPYYHVDAFADRPFTGNQAAVMPMTEWLDDAVLQAIGEENNFAETAFYLPDASGQADYELRWFTPTVEIALCGHATLASGHVILTQQPERDHVTFLTRKAGVLEVWRDGTGYRLALPAYPPEPAEMPDWAALLGGAMPVERQFHPGRYNVLLFESAEQVLALKPDFKALAAYGNEQFICTAPGAGHSSGAEVVSRVFVPGGGVDEDSVTGSAHAVLTPYWAKRLGREGFAAYQASARGGHVGCRLDGEKAWLSGECVTVVEGRFSLA